LQLLADVPAENRLAVELLGGVVGLIAFRGMVTEAVEALGRILFVVKAAFK
jgi:hypothetical protein